MNAEPESSFPPKKKRGLPFRSQVDKIKQFAGVSRSIKGELDIACHGINLHEVDQNIQVISMDDVACT